VWTRDLGACAVAHLFFYDTEACFGVVARCQVRRPVFLFQGGLRMAVIASRTRLETRCCSGLFHAGKWRRAMKQATGMKQTMDKVQ